MDDRITWEEVRDLFGEYIPIEAAGLLLDAGNMPRAEIRQKLMEMSKAKIEVAERERFAEVEKAEKVESEIRPCGGCGEGNPLNRCIGCLHDFNDGTSFWKKLI